MTTYLVECYTPGVVRTDVELAARRAAESSAELCLAGSPVEYHGALLVPEDEVVFHLFSSPSEELVREASLRATVRFDRVLESVAVRQTHRRQEEI